MVSRWSEVWDRLPRQFAADDYMRQVAKTLHGEPLNHSQISEMVRDIAFKLRLSQDDSLLDLCCGNGVITAQLAEQCRAAVGVDFSRPLLTVAAADFSRPNLTYRLASALDLSALELKPASFTRVLLYDALQHFKPDELAPLLRAIKGIVSSDRLILLGGLPFRPYRRRYLNSPYKRLRYQYFRLTGRDLLGTWWRDSDIAAACAAAGMHYAIHPQPESFYNAAFRIDVTIW